MNLEEIRRQIDDTDRILMEQLQQRIRLTAQVAEIKRDSRTPVFDAAREEEIHARIAAKALPEARQAMQGIYRTILQYSRIQQQGLQQQAGPISAMMQDVKTTGLPKQAVVACQGTQGAYASLAAQQVFQQPDILYFRHFAGVFRAVERGLCTYGILPIENSGQGSITQVYDSMQQHHFYIVQSLSMQITHCLLAKPGTQQKDIRTVLSHPQALAQCSAYLEEMPGAQLQPCANTAVAARHIAEFEDGSVAAIASQPCAAAYGLDILAQGIQNTQHNYTRFLCIARELTWDTHANRCSIALTLPDVPGALAGILSQLAAAGRNLTKLESRPIPEEPFRYRFYCDIAIDPKDDGLWTLLDSLSAQAEEFKLLGVYSHA